ncbi:NAD(P)H-dependent oxidoreductase [Paenibacillus pasadenensis]|uniref:NADPH-dependent FMN reductase n=1 Tax=Paenibacillus pasadenensis TaxID=217090 RepID=UPI00203AC8E9|nr:NADPH-dependent FMN reductase [Paenibacillus pasadenensis]MCM3746772.1 NAD(P)H-dependent oxidoreductase [Paenibacillus pasadenensis]
MNILLIAGSSRSAATSTILTRYIGQKLQEQGAAIEVIDLAELTLPIFTLDQPDLHPNARKLAEAAVKADGLVLATPEYHGSISGALKNALDYLQPAHVTGKAVLSVSSAGGPVGISSLQHLQTIIRNLHGINCAEWISIGYGSNAFGADGSPVDAGTRQRIHGAVNHFMELAEKLSGKAVSAS